MYVVKNERQRDYLYLLGFDYKEDYDLYDNSKKVYLFKKTDLLMKAITFYSSIRNENLKNIIV